jgi:glycosyltransferase involved in cell wall biosynthesis
MVEKGYDVYTVSADGPEVAEVLKEGVTHIAIPFTRKITPIRDLKCLIGLIRIIKKIQPDIIHTHTPKAGLLGMLAGWICRVPVRMHTVAGLPLMESSGVKRSLLEITERLTYFCAHKVYPNSAGLQHFMIHVLDITPAKLKVIGKGSSNGIDTEFFKRTEPLEEQARTIRLEKKIRPYDLVFSFVGRIVRDKGIVELVEAFKAVSDRMPEMDFEQGNAPRVFLMFIGTFEPDLDPLPEPIRKFMNEDPRIIVAGFQRDVRPWLMASDIFVFPSYREGFPNVVMQACLLQIPCIVSDINGCNEIIKHEATGLIVPPKDIASLTEAIVSLLKDKNKRNQFSVSARDFVLKNFKREYVWEEIRKEYEGGMVR